METELKDVSLSEMANKLQALFVNLNLTKIDESLEQLKKLVIPQSVMSNGLLFVWSTKGTISSIINILDKKNFYYVENVVFGLFDYEKLQNLAGNIQHKIPNKKNIETFFRQKKSTSEEIPTENKFTQDSLLSFLQNTTFTLPETEKVDEYLVNRDSPYIKTSKVTLLIFRRVI